MSDKDKGLYEKYRVERRNDLTGKHRDCEYFVLDLVHDPHAAPALLHYALSCEREFPQLARDLRAKAAAIPNAAPPRPHFLPPADANGKRPRLFYWEEAEDCWCPAEGLEVENIIGVDLFLFENDEQEIRFKRQDMTDAEFAAIPEG